MNEVEKFEKLITEGEELVLKRATNKLPEFKAWGTNVERLLTYKYGDKSVELCRFKSRPYGPTARIGGVQHDDSIECIRDIQATVLELKNYLEESKEGIKGFAKKEMAEPMIGKIFIIHGHDGELKEATARLLEKQGIEPIILNKQANHGLTTIEKFEKNADVGAAIALFTKDDLGRAITDGFYQPRARQNVIFETGYFMGKLGRNRVVIIADNGIEIPSDLQGVVYTDKNNWQFEVCKELSTMGYSIDMNKLLR